MTIYMLVVFMLRVERIKQVHRQVGDMGGAS